MAEQRPQIKVCGLRDPGNIEEVLDLAPDYIGFIFYVKSSRYVGGTLPSFFARQITEAKKVGVFVNDERGEIEDRIDQYGLDLVQLHGAESPELCGQLRGQGVQVIKVFSVGEAFDFSQLATYSSQVDYFLFDTQGKLPGGNGVSFDWQLLQAYDGEVPYFLSGGIGPEHATTLPDLQLPGLMAVDINSKFETKPGLKDPDLLRRFFSTLRTN